VKTFLKICLFICLFPFSLLYFVFKKKPKKTHKVNASAEDEHFDLMPKIDELYSSVMYSKDYTGRKAKQLEELCKRDMSLAPAVWRCMKRDSPSLRSRPTYPSYRQLATLYERRGDYENAVEVCKKAIRDGYNDDGTQMKMSGRLERIKNRAASK